ncbi:Gldg family protein [Thalassotalea agariperforans]
MQPDIQKTINTAPSGNIKRIAAKEINLFFASPIAYLFLATFAAITLFIFFWGESFFARNISDVRPLFEWMPVLLIFLSATLTMRLWSEERRSGTLEYILTQAVPLWHFVVGKFIGCLLLLIIALIITLPIPLTVAMIGDLDWGPVWSGYIATILLGAAYLSIGLFVSAKSDNQIVSLISASVLCGIFYLIGTSTLTDFFGTQMGEYMRLLGTGSRFEAITRGVIDLRDLYYYISITLIFLTLNTLVLERERWTNKINNNQAKPLHKHWLTISSLIIINAFAANFWLGQINTLRVDVTQGQQYSISDATKGYLKQLQEPLLVRGYFSRKTHPLLAPLVPQMRDLMNEYAIAGQGKVRVEFIDPIAEPELEKEANQKYGIRPVPFQVADRYQSSIVSSYFNIVLQYGDQHQVLAFNDLIEVKSQGVGDIEVQLRNPEHDLTRGIKKVLNSYQAGGNLFDTIKDNITFTGYISAQEQLPEQLANFKTSINKHLSELKNNSSQRFDFQFIDPQANGGKVAQEIAEKHGFAPMSTSIFSQEQFYFYMVLESDQQSIQIPFSSIDENEFERNFTASLKRFATGFTKNIALVTPPATANPYAGQFGMPSSAQGPQFNQLRTFLSEELNVQSEDLSDGSVAGDADILVLAAPQALDEKQLFAVDQFLMQGGTVIATTSPYRANLASGRLSLQQQNSGLQEWLTHHGFTLENSLVLDPQNTAFPIPITRNVGGLQIQDLRMFDYPYFVDIRGTGLNQDNAITADLRQVTIPWASPITIDETKQQSRTLTPLITSSEQSWLSSSLDIMPKINQLGEASYRAEGEQKQQTLAVISQGQFTSFFADKSSPLIDKTDDNNNEVAADETQATESQSKAENKDEAVEQASELQLDQIIKRSPESARLILISSNDVMNDQVLSFLSQGQQTEYLNSLQLIANAIDWSLEDAGLLSIRSRGHFNRTLPPMEQSEQMTWEYLNYGMAILLLLCVALIIRQKRKSRMQNFVNLYTEDTTTKGA